MFSVLLLALLPLLVLGPPPHADVLPGQQAVREERIVELAGRAKEAMSSGRFEEAAKLYEEILVAHPDEAGLHMNLGMARAMAGQPRAALPALERAAQLDPSLLPAQLFLGTVYLDLGEPERAVAPLEKVVAEQHDNTQAAQALGEALLQIERFDEAAERFERLTEVAPQSPSGWAGLGRSYEGGARRSFGELQEIAPGSPYVSLIVAEVMVATRKLPQAFALYREAQKALPELPGVHEAIADIYAASGQADWAASERANARKMAPDCGRKRAACAFLKGELTQAVRLTNGERTAEASYWRTRALNQLATQAFARLERLPPSVELHAVRARIAADQNRSLDAVEELRAALVLAPDDPSLERELAMALHLARDHEAVLPVAEKLLAVASDDPELIFLYGSALLDAQQVDRAIPYLERAVDAVAAPVEAQAALGRALMLKGEAAAAIPHLEAALSTDEDGSLYYQLAQAYQRSKRPTDARAALEKYRDIKERIDAQKTEAGASPPKITPP
ncbi:MAG: tetratricopeptide repeat protein [Luteitalea sp.]|nr:tetratricopeptide repeat protein [Luteitalea sp.]